MNLLTIALIVGLGLGLGYGAIQNHRIKNNLNTTVLRNSDGSLVGGHFKILAGVVVSYFIIGFITTLIIGSVIRWIF